MTEQSHTWVDITIAAIAALPAVIAAVSSLRNGRTLRQNGARPQGVGDQNSPKPAAREDWYKPPDLN